jgi:predicted nucleic acid-binding protein
VEPFTREMGVLAAKIDADMKKTELVIATADLLIGVTALHYGYAVGTRNVRHFRMIPGLQVITL